MMAIAVDQKFFNPHKKEMDKKTTIIEKVAKNINIVLVNGPALPFPCTIP